MKTAGEILRRLLQTNAIYLVVILYASLIVLTWYQHPDAVLTVGDWGMQFNTNEFTELLTSIWDDKVAFGRLAPNQIAYLLPYALVMNLVTAAGFSLAMFQKLMFVFWMAMAGMGMYGFMSLLTERKPIRLFAALLYMFNPFSLQVIWHLPHGMIQQPYAFLPLILGICLIVFTRRYKFTKIALLSVLWTLLVTSSYVGINYALLHWLAAGLLWLILQIYYATKDREQFKQNFKSGLTLVGCWLLLNLFWLLPVIASLSSVKSAATLSAITSDQSQLTNTSVTLVDGIRLTGLWTINGSYKGDPFYSWVDFYNSIPYQAALWLLPILTLLSVLKLRTMNLRQRYIWLFLAVASLITLVLVMGQNSIFGDLVTWIYDNLWFIAAGFRATFLKWGILLAFAIVALSAIGLETLIQIANYRLAKIATGMVGGLLVVVFAVPFIHGTVIANPGQVTPGFNVVVPEDYQRLNDYFANIDDSARVLPLPMSKTNKQAVSWEFGYLGGYFTKWFTDDNPVINADTGEPTYQVVHSLAREIENYSDDNFTSSLAEEIINKLDINYILFLKDTNWDYTEGHSWYYAHSRPTVENFLNAHPDLFSKVATFGNVEVFEVSSTTSNKIYAFNQLDLLDNYSDLRFCDSEQFVTVDSITNYSLDKHKLDGVVSNQCISITSNNLDNQNPSEWIWEVEVLNSGTFAAKALPGAGLTTLNLKIKNNQLQISSPQIDFQLGDQDLSLSEKIIFTLDIDQLDRKHHFVRIGNTNIDLSSLNTQATSIEIPLGKELTVAIIHKRARVNVPNANLENSVALELVDASNTDPGEPDFTATKSSDRIEGNSSINLTSNNRRAAIKLSATEVSNTSSYLFEISHKTLAGPGPEISIIQRDYSNQVLKTDLVSRFDTEINKWDTTSVFLDSLEPETVQLDFYLYSLGRDQTVINLFDDLQLSKLEQVKKVTKDAQDISTQILSVQLDSVSELVFNYSDSIKQIDLPNDSFDFPISKDEQIDASSGLPGEPEFEINFVKDNTEGQFALEMITHNHTQAVSIPAGTNLQAGRNYLISFDYKTLSGVPIELGVVERGNGGQVFRHSPAENSAEWSTYYAFYSPSQQFDSIDLYFYNPYLSELNHNYLDNLNVYEVPALPTVLLENVVDASTTSTPQITYERLNAYTYRVDVTNATDEFFIGFNEGFNHDWAVYSIDKLMHPELPIIGEPESDLHFVLNSAYNGWQVEREGSYSLVIRLTTQNYYFAGMVASLGSLILLLVIVLLNHIRNVLSRHRNPQQNR